MWWAMFRGIWQEMRMPGTEIREPGSPGDLWVESRQRWAFPCKLWVCDECGFREHSEGERRKQFPCIHGDGTMSHQENHFHYYGEQ